MTDAIYWKRDYLALSGQIAAFQERQRLLDIDASQSAVRCLLVHHLELCRELLWAEVNGGLDEQYQADADAVRKSP